jgi:hypothetical protein
MLRNKFILALGTLLLVSTAFATTSYIVKNGDTLSQLAKDHIGNPVYGKNGSLKKALVINPDIKNPDKIYVGDELLFTDEGILIKRTATKEQIEHAEAENMPTQTPTPTPESASEVSEPTETAKAPKPLTHGTIAFRASTGPVYSVVNQSGAFGGYEKGTFNVGLSANLLATFGDGRVEFEYQRVSPALDGVNKQIQNLLIKGGYKFIVIGLEETTAPLGSIVAGNVTWQDLTIVSPILGVHFDWGFEKNAPKETYRKSVDLEAQIPAFAVKDTTSDLFTSSSIGGYGGRLRGRIERSIYSQDKFNLFLGVEADASYQDLHFNGTFNTLSGRVDRSLQLYQGLITLNAEL